MKRWAERSAFTILELTVICAVIAMIGLAVLWLNKTKARSGRVNCISNLKCCQLAFNVWANDNNGQFPMAVSTNSGGTLEWVSEGNAFRHFQVMSNELSGPRVTACPADNKLCSTGFTGFENTNISYFVGLDANKNNPQAWLCGDRNLTNGFSPNRSIITLETGQSAGWTKELHDGCGNVALVDGSVQQISNAKLRSLLKNTAGWTNRIALPE